MASGTRLETGSVAASGVNHLRRSLSLVDLFVLSSSSMAPAYSLAAVMGLVVAAADVGAPLAVIVSTIPIALIAIGFWRLTTAHPSAGAAYSWSRLAFGNRVGWFTATLVILAYYFGTIATALPSGVYTLNFLLPKLTASPVAVGVAGMLWIAFSVYFLVIGARPTARLSAVFLYFELFAILLIAAIALFHPFSGTPPPHHLPIGFALGRSALTGLIAGAVLSIWISAGWEISNYSSEEARGPATTPGLGALVGLLGTMAIVWFCMVAFLHVGTVDGFTQHQEDALAYVASRLGGGWVAGLMTAAVLTSSAAALWTTMLSLSRGIFAMSRDGLLPRAFAAVHPRYGSPWTAILAVGIPCGVVMLLSGIFSNARDTLLTVVGASSIFLGGTFIAGGLACAYLHIKEKGLAKHVLSGVVAPVIGSLWTLAFLVYDVWKEQGPFFQHIILVGIAVALVFAATAGRWAGKPRAMTILKEEA
jgi:amino acid transporter